MDESFEVGNIKSLNFCYVLCLHEGIKTAVCGLKKYPLSGGELKQAVPSTALLARCAAAQMEHLIYKTNLPPKLPAPLDCCKWFSSTCTALPGFTALAPGAVTGGRGAAATFPSPHKARGPPGEWPALGAPSLGPRPAGHRQNPPPGMELAWLKGSKGPVLSQDASVLKSIKGISKQITW